jgi:uncharacterized protein (DUF488 family)
LGITKLKIYTIGFTGKSAEEFFSLINPESMNKLIDIRINRVSQMSGFAKERDLGFFLERISGLDYVVNEDLAPTKSLLSEYRNKEIDWNTYSERYIDLLNQRKVLSSLDESYFDKGVLLCSEKDPIACHRVLLANHLERHFKDVEIAHLV